MTAPLEAGLEACGRRLSALSAAPLATAFSGGGDSLFLMLVARVFAERSGRRLIALHVDHGLQAQSGAWAAEAQAVAAKLGIDCRILRWDGAKPSTGLPAAARAARHRLIADAAREAGAQVVLLGHTLDDQLENAVMRGAGAPVGALGEWAISPAWPQGRGLYHCRPLLAVRRAALRDELAARGLDWLDDPANEDLRYARARARRAVAGGTRGVLPPPADLTDLAAICRFTPWGGLDLDRARLLEAEPARALRLLQIALACASGVQRLARPGRAAGLLARLADGERFIATLAGARIEAGDEVRLSREAGEADRGGLESMILAPGRTAVWDGRFEIAVDEPGWRVEALRGQASRLGPADSARLRDIPAFVRPSLPALRSGKGLRSSVHLALVGKGDHIGVIGASLRALSQDRFVGAIGLVTKEDEIGTFARMANSPPPPYVGVEARTNE